MLKLLNQVTKYISGNNVKIVKSSNIIILFYYLTSNG